MNEIMSGSYVKDILFATFTLKLWYYFSWETLQLYFEDFEKYIFYKMELANKALEICKNEQILLRS